MLIAEDHDYVRGLYADCLRAHGFRVLTASDGRAAYEAAIATHPDIVVMDLSLPQIDGWEATRRLKQNPATSRVPVLACTGHLFGEPVERALIAGCDAYLTKPCPPATLLREVRQLLRRSADARRGRRQRPLRARSS